MANASQADRSESDRLKRESTFMQMVRRPEAGSFVVMMIVIILIFWASKSQAFNALGIKNNLAIIAQFGIIATGAALLMIAGEFDLSIGSMIGVTGMTMAMVLKYGLNIPAIHFLFINTPRVPLLDTGHPVYAFFIALVIALCFGWLIGTIVVRSGLSSFIVSLGFLFGLRGLTEVCFRLINESTQISGLPDFKEHSLFARAFGGQSFGFLYDLAFATGFNLNRKGEQWVTGLDAKMIWWIIIGIAAYLVLSRTQLGNWIYATGDNKDSARANGVPTRKVKVGLFMFTAFCATIFAACQVFDTNTADAAKGNLKELEAIAIAVVGGTLMTGGFGSVIGVAFGAVTFGLVANAVFYIPWIDGSWYRVFVGTVLLAAVFANERIRKRITGGI